MSKIKPYLLGQSNLLGSPKRFDVCMILVILGIVYFMCIGGHALFTPDEGRYSEVAREMVATGDYITPRMNGVVFLDKPVLYYWLQASAIKMFGLNEAALRFWPALLGILSCLCVYIAGAQLFNRRTGILSALILGVTPLYYGAAHYANLDLEVGAFISMSLLCFLMATQTDRERSRMLLMIAAYIFASLATLTKGLIGIAFPILIGGTWIVLLNQWAFIKKMHLVSGIILFACIALPWYIFVQIINPQFFHYFFVTQHFARFLTMDSFNNRTPFWFYLPIIALGFFPWTLFLVQAMWNSFQRVLSNRRTYSAELFLLLWAVIIPVFFSIPRSKTIGYILAVVPALALLVGYYLSEQWNEKKRSFSVGTMIYAAISVSIFIICIKQPFFEKLDIPDAMYRYILLTGFLFLISGLFVLYLRKGQTNHTIKILLITALLFCWTLNISSGTINQKSVKPITTYLTPILKPTDEVVSYYKYFQDLPLYLERRVSVVADWEATDIQLTDNWVRELWYGIPYQDTRSWLLMENQFWLRWHSSKRMFVLVNESDFRRFQARAGSDLYELTETNDVKLVSNTRN